MSRGYFVLEAILYEATLSEAILYEATLSEATLYKIPYTQTISIVKISYEN